MKTVILVYYINAVQFDDIKYDEEKKRMETCVKELNEAWHVLIVPINEGNSYIDLIQVVE